MDTWFIKKKKKKVLLVKQWEKDIEKKNLISISHNMWKSIPDGL